MTSKICRGTVLLGLGLSLVLAGGCNDVSTDLKAPTYNTSIKQDSTRISDFQKDFPLIGRHISILFIDHTTSSPMTLTRNNKFGYRLMQSL